ncbi:MAG: ATP-binding cassette domain-containing protein [Bacteroidota bacterium]
MSGVELIGISKSYGERLVLNDVSAIFPKETLTAIIGKSGGGKSTLLKIINGIVAPSSGKVIAPRRRQIGYLIQGNGLFPHLTVAQNIAIPGKIAGEEHPSRVKELLDLTDLPSSYINKYPLELSGGEQQRVALCRALFLKPPVLLLDEPFSSLDDNTRTYLQGKIVELRQLFHLTIIVVTHNVTDIVRLKADSFVKLENGRATQSFYSADLTEQFLT